MFSRLLYPEARGRMTRCPSSAELGRARARIHVSVGVGAAEWICLPEDLWSWKRTITMACTKWCSRARGLPVHQVVMAAKEELRQLLTQRAEIMKRIGTVKQTIAGLANLFGEDALGERFTGTDRPQAERAAARVYKSVPAGVDGSATAIGRARGVRGTGAASAGGSFTAQGSTGFGDDGLEPAGGVWRGSQLNERSRAARVGVGERGGADRKRTGAEDTRLGKVRGCAPSETRKKARRQARDRWRISTSRDQSFLTLNVSAPNPCGAAPQRTFDESGRTFPRYLRNSS